MSSRAKTTFSAGGAGSTAFFVKINGNVGGGDKKQGLAPNATGFYIPYGKGGGRAYQTGTYAPRRNFIFCMNQLGGVGANKSQQKIRGLTSNEGGAKPCAPHMLRHHTAADGSRTFLHHTPLSVILARFAAMQGVTPQQAYNTMKADGINISCFLHRWQLVADVSFNNEMNAYVDPDQPQEWISMNGPCGATQIGCSSTYCG